MTQGRAIGTGIFCVILAGPGCWAAVLGAVAAGSGEAGVAG
jgi:hypothetical protein